MVGGAWGANAWVGSSRSPAGAVGIASGQLLPPNGARTSILFINDSANVIYLSKAGPAVLNRGIRLNPLGGSYSEPDNVGRTHLGEWYAIATAAGSILCINEGW